MKRIFTAPILVLSSLISGTSASGQDFETLKDSVVQIVAGHKTGSGFIVQVQDARVFVATAFHVVEGQTEVAVVFYRDPHTPFPAKVRRNQTEREEHGLSLLEVQVGDTRGIAPLRLKQDFEVDPKEDVYAIGFYETGAVPWAVTRGTLIGHSEGSLLFDAPIEEGNSGGPLVQDGQVVGVVSSKGPKHNYAVPALLAHYFFEGALGVLPIRCNAPLHPATKCNSPIDIDRDMCDRIKSANGHYVAGDYEEAVAHYDRAIEADPGFAVLFNNRGVIRLTQKEIESAMKDFKRALALDPDYVVALANQEFARTFQLFYQSLEFVSIGDADANTILQSLRRQQIGKSKENVESKESGSDDAKAPQNGLSDLLGGLVRVIYAGAEPFISDMARENFVRLYKEGDFECYGGDLLASNEELNLKHAGDLMEIFESWKEQWRR